MPSAREAAIARERETWKREFEQKQRTNEDAAEYEKYYREMKSQGLEPLNFATWRNSIPEELRNESPEVRGAAASNRAIHSQIDAVKRERYANQKLTDEELEELGFDLRWRPIYEWEISQSVLTDLFAKFRDREPRFDAALHLPPVGYFLDRNRLSVSGPHIETAFNLFWNLGLIEPKPVPAPEPEPERNPDLNAHGVNLGIDRDAEFERKAYENEVIVTDPENGREYTAFQLDRVDSDTYRRLMRIPRVTKNLQLEPRH